MGSEFSSLFVGLNIHKSGIGIAVAESPPNDPGRAAMRQIGSIRGDLASLDTSIRKLVSHGQPPHIVSLPHSLPSANGIAMLVRAS